MVCLIKVKNINVLCVFFTAHGPDNVGVGRGEARSTQVLEFDVRARSREKKKNERTFFVGRVLAIVFVAVIENVAFVAVLAEAVAVAHLILILIEADRVDTAGGARGRAVAGHNLAIERREQGSFAEWPAAQGAQESRGEGTAWVARRAHFKDTCHVELVSTWEVAQLSICGILSLEANGAFAWRLWGGAHGARARRRRGVFFIAQERRVGWGRGFGRGRGARARRRGVGARGGGLAVVRRGTVGIGRSRALLQGAFLARTPHRRRTSHRRLHAGDARVTRG